MDFIHHAIIKENASHLWFYTHNRLRIKAPQSAVNMILSNKPERSHSITSAGHVIFFFFFSRCSIHKQNLNLLTQAGTHTHNECCRTWAHKGQRLLFLFALWNNWLGKRGGHRNAQCDRMRNMCHLRTIFVVFFFSKRVLTLSMRYWLLN